nr:hypothetical protein [uncultured bacterium]
MSENPPARADFRGETPVLALAPLGAADRIVLMDVLRGVALFGVFLMNVITVNSVSVMATELQLLSLPTAAADLALHDVFRWLVYDKANSIFAFLFGLGFFLQMQRLEARGADFESLYRRRLFVLLGIGLVHMVFFWVWEILHLYALAGFALLALRRLSGRDLLAVGIICAILGRVTAKTLQQYTGLATWTEPGTRFTDDAVLARQALSEAGDYFGLVRTFLDLTLFDYVANGFLVGWFFYALGRFLVGAWVGRHGWIARARQLLPGWQRLMRWTLPPGLVLEGAATLLAESPLLPEFAHRGYLAEVAHLVTAPLLATGYVAGLVVLYHGPLGAKLLAPFAWAGRMALTNYLAQSLVMGFVLFGVGPGLALAGHIGTCALTGIVIVAFAAQMLISRWWLGRYVYGPVEWLWRALTYGHRPPLRLARASR